MGCIEREAVMQKFADHVKRNNNSDFAPVPTWNQAVQIVEDFPAADVRPVVRGRNICDTVKGHCEFKCSVCGVEISSVYGGENGFGLDGGYFNFCPNCGADMRKEELEDS